MTRVAFGAFAAVCLSFSAAACGGSHGGTTANGGDGTGTGQGGNGGDTGGNVAPGKVVQKGTIVDFDSKKGVKGATVVAGDQSVTTDATGAYELILDKGKPFTMSVTNTGYAKLIEQETQLDADFDKGKTNLVGNSTANLLLATLDGYDANLGVLSVQLIPTGNCTSESGAKISVTPAGSAKVKYLLGGIPTARQSSVAAGQFPSAVIYNVQPGVPLSVDVQIDTCKVAAFPFTKDGVEYTGGMVTEAGQSTSFARIFLE